LSDTNMRLVESETKLKDLNATKDKFFSIISHDLRNPIASLVSFVRIMNRDYDDMSENEVKELIADMKETTEKAQDLLENLLLWSKTQTGKIVFKPESFNFYDVIQENIQLFQSAISHKQISVQVFAENPSMMFADFNMTKTIVRNLLSNAIKFTHPRGNIRISFENTNKFFIFKIEDDGVGMKKDEIPLIFIPGGQKSKQGTADEKGTGIGLLISKEFVDRHKGHFQINSELGKGSTFAVHIPVNKK
jgi:signal transduction histidine kinase